MYAYELQNQYQRFQVDISGFLGYIEIQDRQLETGFHQFSLVRDLLGVKSQSNRVGLKVVDRCQCSCHKTVSIDKHDRNIFALRSSTFSSR